MSERVVDAHFHWLPEAYAKRLSSRRGFPRAERADDGYRYIYNEGRTSSTHSFLYFDLDRTLPEAQAATGPDTVVVTSTGVLTGVVDQLPVDEAVDVALEHNEALSAASREHPGSVYGTAMVPLNDTAKAVEVADHAVKELGLVGINLPACTADGPTDSARLEPFYDHVERLGVPLIVHPTDILYRDIFTEYESAIFLTVGRLLDSSLNVLRLIFSGILERHPDLKVVMGHAGGILPYQAGRIDKNVAIIGTYDKKARVNDLSEPPSTYLRRIHVDTVAPQPLTIRTALEFFGPSNVVYGTDHPYCWDARKAFEIVEHSALDPAVRRTVLAANAQELFSLPERVDERLAGVSASGGSRPASAHPHG